MRTRKLAELEAYKREAEAAKELARKKVGASVMVCPMYLCGASSAFPC